MTVDTVDRALEADIRAAKEKLLETAVQQESWTAFDLKKRARNGWSSATMGLALYSLVDEGKLLRGDDHRVRRP